MRCQFKEGAQGVLGKETNNALKKLKIQSIVILKPYSSSAKIIFFLIGREGIRC
jgi:hypothetical protein